MASTFTRAMISGSAPSQYGAKVSTHRWRGIAGGGDLLLRKIRIDFDALATATGTALAHSDTYRIMDINAGETVVFCGFNIETVATAAADMDIGIGSDVDGFVDGIEANDATPTVVVAPFGLLSGTTFASADTIDVKEVSGAQTLAGCVCTFWALLMRNT